jgi:hypothetical protein
MGKAIYNAREKVSISKLERIDLIKYAELCECAGYLSTAFGIYLQKGDPKKALELARRLRGVPISDRQLLVDRLLSLYGNMSEVSVGELGNLFDSQLAKRTREEGRKGLENIPTIRRELGLT